VLHEGRVIGISDGDTIKVLENGTTEKIRLRGIDCPERGQPFGKQAKLLTAQLAFGKIVAIKEESRDRYGRIVADIILPDRTSLSSDLVEAGYAWWYRQYAPGDRDLAELETKARLKGIGLWSSRSAIPPWEFRRRQLKGSQVGETTNNPLLSVVHPKTYVSW
jgi:micrococcal nuclease